MNTKTLLLWIVNEILLIQEELDCHIFLNYSPHVEMIYISCHAEKWSKENTSADFYADFYREVNLDLSAEKERIKNLIIEHK